jgi:RHS repeat-associated protein
VFLSSIVDPNGQTLTFTWDAQLRLVAVTDALGQVTTLQYGDGDVLKVTRVTDPFGRTAQLTYDADGHLASVTDVINLRSSFTYGNADFIAALQTPYGVTTFRTPAISGENARAVEATDSLGATERLEFWWQGAPVPASVPADQVPPGFESHNAYLDQITSLYWGKGRNTNTVQEAIAWRWLIHSIDYYWDPGWTVGVPHSIQRPAEARIWYSYIGSTARPSTVARRLPDGTVYRVDSSYNAQDNVTWRKDPVGRELTYTYDTNGIDLLEVRNTTGGRDDLLATYADYTAGHQPQTVTDAAGQVTHTTYNDAGQVLTVTNAKQEQTTYVYDPNGYLQTVTGPLEGATVSYGYDGYGRVQSATPAGEAVVTTAYDLLNRPTRTTYADGTYEELTYDKLDVVSRRDRAGRLTRVTYDSLRRVVASRDPAGRTVQQQWCPCGALAALTDANGHATRWERDAASRVLREVRADGVTDTHYTYDALGRLLTVNDPKQQVTTYTYSLDGAVASIAYTNAQVLTPGMTWTYDPAYSRVTSMIDGTGTTTYTYHPAGQLGAGQVATVDGPLTNDLISFSYDELGRILTRALDGVPLTLTYDTLGRVRREVNALGTFDYTFDGASGRPATVTYPNGQTSTYTYFPALQDHRLQTIHHRYPNGATLSKFDYTYDIVGNILTWRQQADSTGVIWDYGYDSADQLIRAVKHATDPQGTILQRFAYGFDPAGNRLYEQIDDAVTSWTYDRLNRLVNQEAGGLLRVAGTVNEPATVRVQGQPATVDTTGAFAGAIQVTPGTTRFAITATDASGNSATQSYDVDQTGAPKTFTADANRNMTGDGTRTFDWDARNQLVAVKEGAATVASFEYDGMGRRTRKTAGSIVTTYVWIGAQLAEERQSAGTTRHFDGFADDEHLGRQAAAGAISYYVADHLGSIADITNADASAAVSRQYDPWGNATSGEQPGYGFTGRQWDEDGQLYYYRARYYAPELGRFGAADPISVGGAIGPFAYADNNPLRWVDPFGFTPTAPRCPSTRQDISRSELEQLIGPVSANDSANLDRGCIGMCSVYQGMHVVFPEQARGTRCFATEAQARARRCTPPNKSFVFAKQGQYQHGPPTPGPDGEVPRDTISSAGGNYNYVTAFQGGCYGWMNNGVYPGSPPQKATIAPFVPNDPHYPHTIWCSTCRCPK